MPSLCCRSKGLKKDSLTCSSGFNDGPIPCMFLHAPTPAAPFLKLIVQHNPIFLKRQPMKLGLLWHKTYPSSRCHFYRDSDVFGQKDRADEISSVFNHRSLIHMGLDCKSPCSPHAWSTVRLLQLSNLLIAQPIIGCGNWSHEHSV